MYHLRDLIYKNHNFKVIIYALKTLMLSTIAVSRLISLNKSILSGIDLLYGCPPNIICEDHCLA